MKETGGAPHELLHAATLRWLDELAAQGIFTTDTALVIRSWNRWLEQQTGRSAASAIGRPLFEVYPDLVERGFEAHYRAALAGEARVLAHSFHKYLLPAEPGGPEPAQTARIAPLEAGGDITGTITVVEDVSERVASERELRHQIETAEFARTVAEDALRTKDEFLATLSHEIRTPLNAVLGWTKILLSRDVDPALRRRALEVIDRNAVAQMHLIDDMLDMARIMSGKLRLEMQPVELPVVLHAAVDVMAPTATAKGVKLETAIDAQEAWVAGDPDRLQQVIWNLLSNAVKFTDVGGTVKASLARDGDTVRLSVTDTGIGIAEEFLPHMFERFRQAHASASRRHGGLGLGLPLVRQLVEVHGGTVAATSLLGSGSTFTVTLPVLTDLGRGLSERGADDDESLAGIRVLVVEDEADAREMMAMAFRQHGAIVLEAGSCAEALRTIDASLTDREPLRAIFSDIGLADQDGYYLIEQLSRRPRERGGEIPVIAVTAYGLPSDRRRALAAGFRMHIVKPATPEVLTNALRKVLATPHAS